ncbi:hypothetical protein THOG05_110005 [Vibrio rotiferianus]|nr:hypothetical protein THOG05_110005 [Vibrio rotiferianus]CAH1552372.1 hypothetical protein THOE12_120192 [Vibrio rotiferianus]CAH1580224.1 hypothetical protein THOG10_30103 [Vibrio rotiferianus]CAH1582293.1 hypothetical protein THOB06_30103 [Vibrio rotiferianus]
MGSLIKNDKNRDSLSLSSLTVGNDTFNFYPGSADSINSVKNYV